MNPLSWKQVEQYVRSYKMHFKSSDPQNKEVQILNYLLAEHLAEKENPKPVEEFRVSVSRIKKKLGGEVRPMTDEVLKSCVEQINANSLDLWEMGKNPGGLGLLQEGEHLKFAQLPAEDQELFEEEIDLDPSSGEIERLRAEVMARDQVIAQLKGQINQFENKLDALKSKSEFFHVQQAQAASSGSGGGIEEDLSFPETGHFPERISAQIESLRRAVQVKQSLIIGLIVILYFMTTAVWLKLRDQFNQVQGKVELLAQKVPEAKDILEVKGAPSQEEAPLPLGESETASVSRDQILLEPSEKGHEEGMNPPSSSSETEPSLLQGSKSLELAGVEKSEPNPKTASPDVKSPGPREEAGAVSASTSLKDECRNLWASGLKARLSGEGRKALEIFSKIPPLPCAKNKDIDGKSWQAKVENLTRLIKKELGSP